MTTACPIPNILLPVDGSDNSRRAAEFTGCLGKLMGRNLFGVSILYVMADTYFGRHSDYKDLRSEIVKQSDTIKRLREMHIQKDIQPFMDESEKILRDEGIQTEIVKLILDGNPSDEIIRTADEGRFSTIMMARHSHDSETRDFLSGITSKVVHAARKQTVYVIGFEVLKKKKGCLLPKILVPVDGSSYSMRGVKYTACLSGTLKDSAGSISLIRVINTERTDKDAEQEKESQQILDEAEKIFLQAGISKELISTILRTGKPAEEIIREVENENYNMIIMGRKGRGAIKDLILGGVSKTVLQHCKDQTIAIVSSDD